MQARVEHMSQTDQFNKEVRERLEQTRHAYYDRLIKTYLNPESKEYKETHGIAPIETYAHIDALLHVEEATKSVVTEKVNEAHAEQLVCEYEASLLARHQENMRILFEHGYTWTGDVRKDFPTLQQALFQGPDRYLYNPGLDETSYQKDHDQFDEQIQTGIVNCQVARMTPSLLLEIYRHEGLPLDDLDHLHRVLWSDHVISGYEDPESKEKFSLSENYFGIPISKGIQPPGAENPGSLVPASDHLAQYLVLHESTLKQQDQLKKLGYDYRNLDVFRSGDDPSSIIDFGTYEKIFTEDKTLYEVLSVNEEERETTKKLNSDNAESWIENYFADYIEASMEKYPLQGSVITLPPWIRSEPVRTFLEQTRLKNYYGLKQKTVNAYILRALQLDGAYSEDLIKQAVENNVQVVKQWLAEGGYQTVQDKAGLLSNQDVFGGPFGIKTLYQLRTEPWFDPALEFLINYRIDGIKEGSLEIQQNPSKHPSNPNAFSAKKTLNLLEALGREDTQTPNPYLRKAKRLREAIAPYEKEFDFYGWSPEDLQTMSLEQVKNLTEKNPTVIDFLYGDSAENLSSEQIILKCLEADPEFYENFLLQFTQKDVHTNREMSTHLLAIHTTHLSRILEQHPQYLERFQEITSKILRSYHTDGLSLLEKSSGEKSVITASRFRVLVSDLLQLSGENPWILPVVTSELQFLNDQLPFTDFDIYYAKLDHFGIPPSHPIPINLNADNYYEEFLFEDWTKGMPPQEHKIQNPEVDQLIRDTYFKLDSLYRF